ncbi:MAG TPA: hypothetical protein VF280_08350 [Burkholderiales bacterium]|jgi:ElaB/YqjD/DUF883 family membrane-anchored ribosome-binding protein
MEPTGTRSGSDHIERASSSAHDAVDRVAQTASAYAERFGEQAEALMEMKDNWVEGARDYVREHPIAALGMAAAAGYVLSMLMRSRD